MENKEVEIMLESIKVEFALLEGKVYYQSKDIKRLLEDNQSLTKENAELKQQIQAKDKALDKACVRLSSDVYIDAIDGHDTKEGWKEWCENGTD